MYIKSKKIGFRNIFLTKNHFKKYTRFKNKKRRNNKKQKCKIKILLRILFIIILLFCVRFIIYKFYIKYKYQQDDLTIVSAYYKIKSKHKPEEYYIWLRNFALLNKSMVFFASKEFMPAFKELRPKELYNKTFIMNFKNHSK